MNGSFIDFLRRIGHLCRKELLAILKDPSSRVILIMPALMQSLLFGYAATFDLAHVDYALLDQSRGAASTALIARFDGTGVFKRAATLTSPEQIASLVSRQDALVVIQIGPEFERQLNAGEDAPIQVIID